MAGHSKWANIKHKKKKEDKKRAKLFSKLSKKIAVAAREGGGDPEKNPDLRRAIEKAQDNNMPNDNIEGVNYEEFVYEGYGPGGVALYLEIMSDNRNRTASELRHVLSERGGNLGQSGCVAWMFERKGQYILDLDSTDLTEDELMLEALEADAQDVLVEGNTVTIYADPTEFEQVKENLKDKGFDFNSTDIAMIPNNNVKLDKRDAKKMLKLMDELEDHDDVQEIYANFDIPDNIMEEIAEQDD